MTKHHLTLTDNDRTTLEALLSKGTLAAKTFKRATALLALDRGKTLHDVALTVDVATITVSTWRDGYTSKGLAILYDAPRSGRPPTIDGLQRAKITALACSSPPTGHAQWSLRLLADAVVEAAICATISRTAVGNILKKTT